MGLTLIEVLFALSVLAFALLGVAGMFPSAMRSVSVGGQMTKATMLARGMIDMIRADQFDRMLGYNGFDTGSVTVTCPVPPPTASSPDADYNKKKWTCDIAASGTRDTGQGLPGGRGTIAVACVGFSMVSPFNEMSDSGCTQETRKVTVTITWDKALRVVSLVTYVTRIE